jgi:hypothetical protein
LKKEKSGKRTERPDADSAKRAAQAPYSSEAEDYRGEGIKTPKSDMVDDKKPAAGSTSPTPWSKT